MDNEKGQINKERFIHSKLHLTIHVLRAVVHANRTELIAREEGQKEGIYKKLLHTK
jgi:hypothetical protein